MTESRQASAGWYDDPEMVNTRRYWDGAQWTEHRQEGATRSASPSVASGSSFWRWVGGIAVAIVIAVVVLSVLYGRGILGGGVQYDPDEMASEIQSALEERGVVASDLTCSDIGTAHQGDVSICEGTTDKGGDDVSVSVTFNSDGSYVWRQQ